MTGKDFSGPTPEIRAPTPVRSIELQPEGETEGPQVPRAARENNRASRVQDLYVEIVGDIEEAEKQDA